MNLRDVLWDLWVPDWDGGGPWHLRWRATVAWWIRRAWYLGAEMTCTCPGCPERIAKASATWLCHGCISEDCDHEEAFECATCKAIPDLWQCQCGEWVIGCGCGEVKRESYGAAIFDWNERQEYDRWSRRWGRELSDVPRARTAEPESSRFAP